MPVGLEEDDIKFNDLLAQERHRELVSIIKRLTDSISGKGAEPLDGVSKIEAAISKLIKTIESFTHTPDIKIETNQNNVVTSIEKLGEDLIDSFREYSERPLPDEIELRRDDHFNIKGFKVFYKPASQVTQKKELKHF